MRRSFISRRNTEKRVKNTTHSGVFLTNFELFHLLMKHCVECLILLPNKRILEGEIKDAKMSCFPSDFQTLIKHEFPWYFLYKLLMSSRRRINCLLVSYLISKQARLKLLRAFLFRII